MMMVMVIRFSAGRADRKAHHAHVGKMGPGRTFDLDRQEQEGEAGEGRVSGQMLGENFRSSRTALCFDVPIFVGNEILFGFFFSFK